MAAIDDEAQGAHLAPRLLLELDTAHRFQIDGRHLLAAAQIGDGRVTCRGGNPEGDTAAHSAPVETQHQSGPLGRAAMDKRIDTQRPVQTDEPSRYTLDKFEARIPHQRAIAENPEVFRAMLVEQFLHRRMSPKAPPVANLIQKRGRGPTKACICAKTPSWRRCGGEILVSE
jgi:hypothetical protein